MLQIDLRLKKCVTKFLGNGERLQFVPGCYKKEKNV